MILLYNGCRASNPAISPKNWNSGASTKKNWFVHYRFYDPEHLDKYPKGKQVILTGESNRFKNLKDRRIAIKDTLETEKILLIDEGYNPITNNYYTPETLEVSPQTQFIKALRYAESKIHAVIETKRDIGCVIRGVETSARELSFTYLPLSDISRKHIKMILEQCFKNNERFTPGRFNKYKAYLSRLFRELVELEACDYNPTRDISNMKETKRQRLTLTDEERRKVYDHLYRVNRPFLSFVQLFYHSGARITELVSLQGKDVNLVTQKFRCIIKKGRSNREVFRTIKDISLPIWTEFVQNCLPDDYVFGKDLEPGKIPIDRAQITRRWKIWVKRDLGIKADIYSLKHSHTDEIVELLSMNDAAAHNGHTTTRTTAKVYAINEKERQHERLKKVQNYFA